MKPTDFKHTAICGTVILIAVIFSIAALATFMAHPSVYAGLSLVPAGYGVWSFYKKYYPKDEE